MPRISERGTPSGGSSLNNSIDRVSNIVWSIFNVIYFYFQSLLDPFLRAGKSFGSSTSSRNGRGPPRPPGRGNFRSFSDFGGTTGYIPPPPPGG